MSSFTSAHLVHDSIYYHRCAMLDRVSIVFTVHMPKPHLSNFLSTRLTCSSPNTSLSFSFSLFKVNAHVFLWLYSFQFCLHFVLFCTHLLGHVSLPHIRQLLTHNAFSFSKNLNACNKLVWLLNFSCSRLTFASTTESYPPSGLY